MLIMSLRFWKALSPIPVTLIPQIVSGITLPTLPTKKTDQTTMGLVGHRYCATEPADYFCSSAFFSALILIFVNAFTKASSLVFEAS